MEMGLRIPPAIRIPPLFSRFLRCSLLGQEEAIRIPPLFSRLLKQGGILNPISTDPKNKNIMGNLHFGRI